jgi:hypothetical protein
MTSQSTRQSGRFSGFASILANSERCSRLFTQVCHYSRILGPNSYTPIPTQSHQSRVLPMSSLPSASQHSENGPERHQAQTEEYSADSNAPAGTARNSTAVPSDPVVATNSNNEERLINAVLGLSDIIAASHSPTTKIQKVKNLIPLMVLILASLMNGLLKSLSTSLRTLQYLNLMKTKCSLLCFISIDKL